MAVIASLQPQIVVAKATSTLSGWAVWELQNQPPGVSRNEAGSIHLPKGKYLIALSLATDDTAVKIRSYNDTGNVDVSIPSGVKIYQAVVQVDSSIRVESYSMSDSTVVIHRL